MAYKYNPLLGVGLDEVGAGGGGAATPGGANTQVQFNDGGALGGDSGLSYNKTTDKLTVGGDIDLGTVGTFSTTLQTVTPTANRTVSIPDATGTIGLVNGPTGSIQFNQAGALNGTSDFSTSLVWNNAATTFTGLKLNVTDTASAADSKLLDLQVNGVSSFSVIGTASSASLNGPGVLHLNSTGSTRFNFGSAGPFFIQNNQVRIANFGLTFCSGTNYNSPEFTLLRDAANTLAQRNGTNAQTYRLYNTYTDASNYERLDVRWTGTNSLKIETAAVGTGTARPLDLVAGGSLLGLGAGGGIKWYVTLNGGLAAASDTCKIALGATGDTGIARDSAGVVKITDGSTGTGYLKLIPTTVGALTAAATVGAGTKAFVTDSANTLSSHHGQTVAGGGSNFVPVFSDGTNWIVG